MPNRSRLRQGAALLILAVAAAMPASAADFDFPDPDILNGRPPNFVVIPGFRVAMRRQIDAESAVESYVLTQVGLAGRPFIAGASGFAGG
uniref:hypothetical protein n=1 Tax=Klebsiella pneumoniae TaxID=573 RepID=UPI0013D7130B